MWVPAATQVRQLITQNSFAFWRCWRGMALKDNVVFLGTEDIGFNKVVLPHNLEYNYFPLYLYTLHQKYKLLAFSSELMRKSAQAQRNLREVRSLMASFMRFRNMYWFSEVTRKPLGGELYRKFQNGLEVPALYDLVSNEVKDLKEYYEQQHEQRMSTLLAILTFVFLPLGAVVGIFGMTFFNTGSWWTFITACILVEIVSLGLWKWWTQDWRPRP
jgi:Mg2+ and Co2+ transporter CorA